MKVDSVEEVNSIPEHAYNIGFNDIYETPDNQTVAVPDGTKVPDGWELISS